MAQRGDRRVVRAGDDELPAGDAERDHLGEAARRDEASFRENGHAAAQRLGVAQDVRAEEDGASAIAQPENQRSHVAAPERIETRHRLVEDHELGIVDERLRDADALEHPLREFPELQLPLRADAHFVEQPARADAAIGAAIAEEAGEVREQLLGSQVVVEERVFRKVTDALLDADVADRPAEHLRAARRRKHQLHQQLQRRRLARAVRPEKPEHLAGLDVEREAAEGAVGPLPPESNRVVFGEVERGERGGHYRVR
jgi:hypothetical protein